MSKENEKARIIKEALLIVDKLGTFGTEPDEYEDSRELEELIKKAKILKKSVHWKLR